LALDKSSETYFHPITEDVLVAMARARNAVTLPK
jgi:hypothetical protein